jgi:hypothetical protein
MTTNYTSLLDNVENIAEVQRIQNLEMEPLYWKLEDALYEGKIKLARVLHEMFLYIAKYNRPLLNSLQPRYRQRLKEITYELNDGSVIVKRCPVEIQTRIRPKGIPFEKEADLRDYLVGRPDLLTKALGENVKVVGKEVETDFEYRCDIVVENDKRFFPIELKIVQAKHAVVSQIEKYVFYFYRTLRYTRYRDIQGVVMSDGFDDYAINELRKRGMWIYDISGNEHDKISLRRIV